MRLAHRQARRHTVMSTPLAGASSEIFWLVRRDWIPPRHSRTGPMRSLRRHGLDGRWSLDTTIHLAMMTWTAGWVPPSSQVPPSGMRCPA